MGAIRDFMEKHYLHFNARETVAAAKAWEDHLAAGGKMMVTLAGAMSTGELGIILARMIREGKVHAISCTGANLEEDVFNLVGPSLPGLPEAPPPPGSRRPLRGPSAIPTSCMDRG